jgi:integrase
VKAELTTSRGIKKAEEVEPIKSLKDIQRIKQYLLGKENKRDYLMFVLGINVGLRASDLLALKIADVSDSSKVTVIEQKTKKVKKFTLNRAAKEAIELYISSLGSYTPEDYLFPSQKGGHLTVSSAHRIIKAFMRELGIRGNYGTHSLRKTFGYHLYTNNITSDAGFLNTLQKIYNHSSSLVTLRYIGITSEVISDAYKSLNL